MIVVMEKGITEPVNLGSGQETRIRDVVEAIVECLDNKPRVEWDVSKPSGDSKRVMDVSRARSAGFAPKISLKEGIRETLAWYRANRESADHRYNVFVRR
jgi:GDP-L-fucose synthase